MNALNNNLAKVKQDLSLLNQELEDAERAKASLLAQNQSVTESIKLSTEQQLQIESYVESEQNKLNKLRGEIEEVNNSIKHETDKLKSKAQEVNDYGRKIDRLLKGLSDVRKELATFEAKKRLYSEDFSTYKIGVMWNNAFYGFLLITLVFIGGHLLLQIKDSATELVQQFDEGKIRNIWALLVSRLPTISVNIIFLSFFITMFHKLTSLIIKNNNHVSDVKQISYLVKQISEVQASGLDLSDEEIYDKRIQVKLDLVREFFLKKHPDNMGTHNENPSIMSILGKKAINSKDPT